MTGVVLIGIVIESRIARENLNTTDLVNGEETGAREIKAPEVEAGVWLRSHTPPDSVVMARHWPTVFHYAKRKLVWFAPISDPGVLLDGIVKHGVDYVVVVKHDPPYYLPDDDYCFDRLLAVHAKSFSIVLQRGNLRIFKVDERAMPEPLVPIRTSRPVAERVYRTPQHACNGITAAFVIVRVRDSAAPASSGLYLANRSRFFLLFHFR